MAKKRVKVKHIVKSDSAYCEELFNLVLNGYKQVVATVYPTVEAETAALALIKDAFKAELDAALCDAYKIGTKIGVKKSDKADNIMYAEAPTVATVEPVYSAEVPVAV